MIEEDTLSIKYYEEVLRLNEELIELKMHDQLIRIRGENLLVTYFSNVEVVVHGQFSSVRFQCV